MRHIFVGIALTCVSTAIANPVLAQPGAEKLPAKIGQIWIVGNCTTMDSVIRQAIGLQPGAVLRYPELRNAERALARLNIFEIDAETGARPTVTVLDSDSPFKDILVQVQETSTGTLTLQPGVTAAGDLVVSLVLEERNFDPFRFPVCPADIRDRRAFRGAGQKIRLEVLQIRVLPCRMAWLSLLEKGLSLAPMEPLRPAIAESIGRLLPSRLERTLKEIGALPSWRLCSW